MTVMKTEKNQPQAAVVATNRSNFFNEPQVVKIESGYDHIASHLSPGIVVNVQDDMVILKDTQVKSKRKVPLADKPPYEIQGLPNNRVALLSSKRIRIISCTDGATIKSPDGATIKSPDGATPYDFDIWSLAFPIKTPRRSACHIELGEFQVSLDNQYLLVGYNTHYDTQETKALIVLIELATGVIKQIPVKSDIASFTLMDVNQLLVLYKKNKIELITFGMTSSDQTRHHSVSIQNWQFKPYQQSGSIYSGWSSRKYNYVVIGELYLYQWSLNLFKLPRNDNPRVLTYMKAIGINSSYTPTLMPTSLIYQPYDQTVMEFSFIELTSKLLISTGPTFSLSTIVFANFQLGIISSHHSKKIDHIDAYNLTSVEQYKKRYDAALTEVIPTSDLVHCIRDYANSGFFSVPGLNRDKAVVEEIVESTAAPVK